MLSLVVVLATGLAHPKSIDVDDRNVYFAALTGVHRVPKRGGKVVTIFSARASLSRQHRVAVGGEHLYFVIQSDLEYSIHRSPRSGGPATELFRSDGAVYGFAADENAVYWLDIDSLSKIEGDRRTVLATDLRYPRHIVLEGDHAYFKHGDRKTGAFSRVSRRDGRVEHVYSMTSAVVDLDIDGDLLCYAGRYVIRRDPPRSREVRGWIGCRTPRGGRAVYDELVDAILLHGDYVYFTRSLRGDVERVHISTGRTSYVAASQRLPIALATDGESLYWSNAGSYDPKKSLGSIAVMRLPN